MVSMENEHSDTGSRKRVEAVGAPAPPAPPWAPAAAPGPPGAIAGVENAQPQGDMGNTAERRQTTLVHAPPRPRPSSSCTCAAS